jgi:hypothetical protein
MACLRVGKDFRFRRADIDGWIRKKAQASLESRERRPAQDGGECDDQAAAEPGTVLVSDGADRLISGLFVVEERGARDHARF